MLESKGLTPDVNSQENGSDEDANEVAKKEETTGEIEPLVRESKVKKLQQQAEIDKRVVTLEYTTRKLKEENEALRKELGTEYQAPSKSEYTQPSNDDIYLNKFKEIDSYERQREIKDFVRDNPDYTHLGSALEKFAAHPAYEQVPVDFIAKALNYDTAKKKVMETDDKAREKALLSQTGGNPITKKPDTAPDYGAMSQAEFETQLSKVKRGQ